MEGDWPFSIIVFTVLSKFITRELLLTTRKVITRNKDIKKLKTIILFFIFMYFSIKDAYLFDLIIS